MNRTIGLGLGWEFRIAPAEDEDMHGWVGAHCAEIVDTITGEYTFGPFFMSEVNAVAGYGEGNKHALANAQNWAIDCMADMIYSEEEEPAERTAFRRAFVDAWNRADALEEKLTREAEEADAAQAKASEERRERQRQMAHDDLMASLDASCAKFGLTRVEE